MQICDIMTKKVISVEPQTSIMDAVALLSKHGISGMPVVNQQRTLVGIVTEFDIMKRLIEYYIPSYMTLLAEAESGSMVTPRRILASTDMLIKDIMTKKVVTVREYADALDAARLITRYDINPIPVIDASKTVVGIVSRSDIVKCAVDIFPPAAKKRGKAKK